MTGTADHEITDQELLRTYAAAKYNYRYEGPIDDWPRNEERALTVAGLRAVIAADRARRATPPAEGDAGVLAEWPPSVAAGCHQAAIAAVSGSPEQQLLAAAGNVIENLWQATLRQERAHD